MTTPDLAPIQAGPTFAHPSEAEMARILDFYEVRWEYEPDVFPILWSLDGAVLESFAPDFYLPDIDLYLELTTLRQKLVRKKNRKLRRLRELYPDVHIKLFYARDFRALMLKYGKLGILDDLSGTIEPVVTAAADATVGPVGPLVPVGPVGPVGPDVGMRGDARPGPDGRPSPDGRPALARPARDLVVR